MLDGVVAPVRQGLAFRGAQVDEACVERVQALVRQRVLALYGRCRLLSRAAVAVMQGWGHSGGVSMHAGVRAAVQDSDGRERLLRYCAGPMFAGERLPWAALYGHRPEQQQQRSIELRLSASEFLDRVAALIPPPRKHLHRYFGVLAPHSPWRIKWCSKVWECGWRGLAGRRRRLGGRPGVRLR